MNAPSSRDECPHWPFECQRCEYRTHCPYERPTAPGVCPVGWILLALLVVILAVMVVVLAIEVRR